MIYELTLYRHQGCWVYDDPEHDRIAEALVLGASEIVDMLQIRHLPHRFSDRGRELRQRIRVEFSDAPFSDAIRLDHVRSETLPAPVPGTAGMDGDWYRMGDHEGWLCPALLDFFPEPPAALYVRLREPIGRVVLG
jgi:hypothetical protein